MSATISCPWCAKGIEVNPDLQAGNHVHCPRCRADFAVLVEDLRAAALAVAALPAVAPIAPLAEVGCVPVSPCAAPPVARAWPLALTVGAAALLFLMATAVGAVVLFAGKRPSPVAVVSAPTSAAPQRADPVPPPVNLPRHSDDDRPVPPPKPAEEPAPSPPSPPPVPPPPPSPAPPDGAPRTAEGPRPPADPAPAAFKRRDQLAEEDLRKQLLQVPEVALDAPADARGSTALFTVAIVAHSRGQAYPGPTQFLRQRPDLDGLPLTMGLDCQLGKEPAENLQALSHKMHETVAACLPNDGVDLRPKADELRQRLFNDDGKQWLTPDAVPCLLQMLQPENKPVRLILVDALGRIPGRRATQALAMRAMMDLSPEVREAAVRALRDRPRADSRDILLHGLRYPWPPVIDHAAEALVALDDKEAAPSLVPLLDLPDPAVPELVKKDKGEVKAVPELVRVNHLRNCVLCHSPSLDAKELVRGAVPTQGQSLQQGPSGYGGSERFVRADVTYLRQDFSVMQPVTNPGPWPDYQRFDYLIRLRRPRTADYETADHRNRPLGDEPREALLFALRELTGRDAGATASSWQAALGKTATAGPAAPQGEGEGEAGDWRQFRASLRPAAVTPLSVAADRLKDQLLTAEAPARAGLIRGLAEGDDPAGPTALARAIPALTSAARAQARDALADRLGRMAEADLRDRLSDDDPEIRRAAARACAHREDKGKALTADLILLLVDDDATVAEAAHDILTAATGQDFGPPIGAAPADREKARAAWAAWLANAQPK